MDCNAIWCSVWHEIEIRLKPALATSDHRNRARFLASFGDGTSTLTSLWNSRGGLGMWAFCLTENLFELMLASISKCFMSYLGTRSWGLSELGCLNSQYGVSCEPLAVTSSAFGLKKYTPFLVGFHLTFDWFASHCWTCWNRAYRMSH